VPSNAVKAESHSLPVHHSARISAIDDSECALSTLGLDVPTAIDSSPLWYLDSACTNHITRFGDSLLDYHSLSVPQRIRVGNGETINAIGIGTAILPVVTPSGSHTVTLSSVYHAPAFGDVSLVSLGQLQERGASYFSSPGGVTVVKGDRVVLYGYSIGRLYRIRFQSAALVTTRSASRIVSQTTAQSNVPLPDSDVTRQDTTQPQSQVVPALPTTLRTATETLNTWHRRLGHLNSNSIQLLSRNSLGMKIASGTVVDKPCLACLKGKQHRQPSRLSMPRAEMILERIHTDIWGPAPVVSIGGMKYFATWIDDASRFVIVSISRTKGEAFEAFKTLHPQLERLKDKKIKFLRSDNALEYGASLDRRLDRSTPSSAFADYLKTSGIVHEYTVPSSPEQNGVAERMNRTLLEMVNSMLHENEVPSGLWAEALQTAVYLRNRAPTSAHPAGKTPFEVWNDRPPYIGHLKIFGSVSHVHIPKALRNKLESHSHSGLLVSYEGTNIYRIYVPDTQRIIRARDVHFDETATRSYEEIIDITQPPLFAAAATPSCVLPIALSSSDSIATGSFETSDNSSSYGPSVLHSSYLSSVETVSYRDALGGPDRALWETAIAEELAAMKKHSVWVVESLPAGRKALPTYWVLRYKFDSSGAITRYKARLVARGDRQVAGIDYDETYAPVVKWATIRTVLAFAAAQDMNIHQLDIVTAFLGAPLDAVIYLRLPCGTIVRLLRSIYGLKQSPRQWFGTFHEFLLSINLKQSTVDHGLYLTPAGGYLLLYVDDIVLCGTPGEVTNLLSLLKQRFEIKDLGAIEYLLGIKVKRDRQQRSISLSQELYLTKVLERFKLHGTSVRDQGTLMDVSFDNSPGIMEGEPADPTLYRSAIGSVMYAMLATRPDIAYSISILAQFNQSPTQHHWRALRRLLRYLRTTKTYKLTYYTPTSDRFILPTASVYSDASYAREFHRHSVQGYLAMVYGAPVSWHASKQSLIATSTNEAEFIALSTAGKEALWLSSLLRQLQPPHLPGTSDIPSPITLFTDNAGAKRLIETGAITQRTKHIDIRYRWLHEYVRDGYINLGFIGTLEMLADICTKPLGVQRHNFLLSSIRLSP